jgi:hypothetical protein
VQSAWLVDCEAERSRKAGFLCKNEEDGGLVLEDCHDTGSAYSLVIEYGGNGSKVKGFVSAFATRRALQMVGSKAEVEIAVLGFAGTERPVRLGITERLEFVDAPAHARDLVWYRARGYRMAGNRIRLVTDRPMEVVEVHAPSVNSVEMDGVTVEYYPPAPAIG